MRPLQSIGMGLVIVALHAAFGGYDALADPVGWVLVLMGVRDLPADLDRRSALFWLAGLAGAISIPLWIPGVADALNDADPSLLWAANLPQLGFGGLLAHSLARRAADAGEAGSAAWLRLVVTGFVAAALLPILVFGGGVDALEVPTYVGASVLLLAFVWLLFSYSARPWATTEDATRAAPPMEERPS